MRSKTIITKNLFHYVQGEKARNMDKEDTLE